MKVVGKQFARPAAQASWGHGRRGGEGGSGKPAFAREWQSSPTLLEPLGSLFEFDRELHQL